MYGDEQVIEILDDNEVLPQQPFAPFAKRAKVNESVSSNGSEAHQPPPPAAANTPIELAKKHMATIFNNNDFDAASTLADYCMSNLAMLYIDQERALQRLQAWLNGKPNEPQSSLKSRALELLTNAREHNKALGLSDIEHLLFVICKAAKSGSHQKSGHRMTDPHKLVFMLLSGRSERWYDNGHKALLEKLGK